MTDTVLKINFREFIQSDAPATRALFIKTNRLLAPPELAQRFEDYITSSLIEEVDRVAEYYREKSGSFWVATIENHLVGMFGLELTAPRKMELRRMYVDNNWQKRGIARKMLNFAEDICRSEGVEILELSTSELQPAALSLYRSAGYTEIKEAIADGLNNKTIGGGIRRFHFEKTL